MPSPEYKSPFGSVYTTGFNESADQVIDPTGYGNFNDEVYLRAYYSFLAEYKKVYDEVLDKKLPAQLTDADFTKLAEALDASDELKQKAAEAVSLYKKSPMGTRMLTEALYEEGPERRRLIKGDLVAHEPELPSLLKFVTTDATRHKQLLPSELTSTYHKIVSEKTQLDPFKDYWEVLKNKQWKNSEGHVAIYSEMEGGQNLARVSGHANEGRLAIVRTLQNNKMLKQASSKKEYLANIEAGIPTYYQDGGLLSASRSVFYINYGKNPDGTKKDLATIQRHSQQTLSAVKLKLAETNTVYDNINKPIENQQVTLLSAAKKAEIEAKLKDTFPHVDEEGNPAPIPAEIQQRVTARMAALEERGGYRASGGEVETRRSYRPVLTTEETFYQEQYTQVLLEEETKVSLEKNQGVLEGLVQGENESAPAYEERKKKCVVNSFSDLTPAQRENNIALHQKVAQSLGYHSVKAQKENGDFEELRVFDQNRALDQGDKNLFNFAVDLEKNKMRDKSIEILSDREIESLRNEINRSREDKGFGEISPKDFRHICKVESVKLGHQFVEQDDSQELVIYQKALGRTGTEKEELKGAITTLTNSQHFIMGPLEGPEKLKSLWRGGGEGEEGYINPACFKRFKEILLQLGCTVSITGDEQMGYNIAVYHRYDAPAEVNTKVNYAIDLVAKEKDYVVFKSNDIKTAKVLKKYELTDEQLETVVVAIAQEQGLTLSYTEQTEGHDVVLKNFTVSVPKSREMDEAAFMRAVQRKAEELYPAHKPSANANLLEAANRGQNREQNQLPPNPFPMIPGR